MLEELPIKQSLLSLVPTEKFQAALDSGTSSHAIKASCLPENVNVDRSKARPVGTAGSEIMLSQGAADAGELERILVMEDDQLSKNLVSISRFDVSGHTIIFDEGVCTIKHKRTGIIKGTGYLDKSTMLYMIDVRTLTEHREDLLLASAPVKETAILWHNRLGHRQMRALLKYRDGGLVTGILKSLRITDSDRHICDACA